MAPKYPKHPLPPTPPLPPLGPLSQEDVAQGGVRAAVAVRGAEVALCWACSGLGRGTAHPGFNGNHPINSPFSFLDCQLAKKSTPKASLKMALAHQCLLEHVHEEVLGLPCCVQSPHGHYLVEMSTSWGCWECAWKPGEGACGRSVHVRDHQPLTNNSRGPWHGLSPMTVASRLLEQGRSAQGGLHGAG